MTDDDRQRAAETPAGGAEGVPSPAAGTDPSAAADLHAAPDAAPAVPPGGEPSLAGTEPGPEGEATPADPEPAQGRKKKKRDNTWWDDLKAILWLLLAVLLFHSCVAKPFYIPSESMMPGLLKGDRLVVSKFPYGWSWVSPSFHIFPHWEGRIWGAMPRRGDIVIVTPRNSSSDYIKRVIGLPGDTIQLIAGQVFLNGRPLRREERPPTMIPVDANVPCGIDEPEGSEGRRFLFRGTGGRWYCRLPVFREYIPDGSELRAYDTIDGGYTTADDFPLYRVPAGHVFLMGDNRDDSADSRVSEDRSGLGGAVPWENIGGRAEFITFSLDGSSSYWNPVSWFTALRGGRAGTSLHPSSAPQTAGQDQGQNQNRNQGAPRP
ncbi:MAG TPA: signal peptidase I [Allosphingosinicella sp.]|nr:signal peptidase I [Allosphingosinicella sp.]